MALSLLRTTAATFEELALLFPDASPTPEQEAQPLDVTVSVEFRGPVNGRLVVRSSECILPSLAANMLGEDESRRPTLQRDALGEVANVICGNLLPVIAGANAVFHLAAPRVHDQPQSARVEDLPVAQAVIGVEDGRVEASLFLFGDVSELLPLNQGLAVA